MDFNQKIWLITVVPIAGAIGSLPSGYLIDKRGRKEVLVVSTLFLTLGLAGIYFSEYVTYLLIGRAICGVGIGGALTVIPAYLGEISETHNRGFLGMCQGIFILFGMLITYALGFAMTLNEMNMMFFILSFIILLTIDWWLPESYQWLLIRERVKDAEICLRQVRRSSDDDLIGNELMMAKKIIADSYSEDVKLMSIFKKKYILKSLYVSCGLILFQQVISVSLVLYYIQPVFVGIAAPNQVHLALITICFIQFLTCGLISLVIDKIGRKILMITSAIGSGLSLVALGIFFQIRSSGNDLSWLEITSVISFAIAFTAGLGPIPFVIFGEIFPHQIKPAALAGTTCFWFVSIILVASIFLPLLNLIGEAAMFGLLGVICLIAGLFVYFCVPETKMRSLEDIQDILRN